MKKKLGLTLFNNFLIPPGFKDEVTFNAYVEHEYKNKIIEYFKVHGFDLVKTPLIEFKNKQNDNNFLIESKKRQDQLKIRNDITPQIIRIASSRLIKRKRPLKLCYYGEVIRKYGSMLRPERQFLQVGAETIGENNIQADLEIISIAYKALSLVGIKNITIELSSKIFLDKLFSKISNKSKLKKLEKLIKKKDLDSSLEIVNDSSKAYLKNIFKCTGSFEKITSNLDLLCIDSKTSKEIQNIKKIIKSISLKKADNFFIDFCEIDEKKYHNGIRFTFFAKDVRGEIASGGRYFIKNNKISETATGFTCFMDTVIRASSFENVSKKILIPFNVNKTVKNKLLNKGFTVFTFFNETKNIKKEAKNYGCNFYLEDMKVKSI